MQEILRLHFQRNNHRRIVTLQISVVINRDAGSSSFSIGSTKSVHYKFSAGDEGKNCEQEQPLIARVWRGIFKEDFDCVKLKLRCTIFQKRIRHKMNKESEPWMTEKDRANFGRTLQRNQLAQRKTHIRGVNKESGT